MEPENEGRFQSGHLIFSVIFFFFFERLNVEFLHTSRMKYKNGKSVIPEPFILNYALTSVGWALIWPPKKISVATPFFSFFLKRIIIDYEMIIKI